jgi:hypothetical protein
MTPFGTPLDRQHVPEREESYANWQQNAENLPNGNTTEAGEAAARILTQAAKRIRNGESVKDVCGGLVDTVIALSGRV